MNLTREILAADRARRLASQEAAALQQILAEAPRLVAIGIEQGWIKEAEPERLTSAQMNGHGKGRAEGTMIHHALAKMDLLESRTFSEEEMANYASFAGCVYSAATGLGIKVKVNRVSTGLRVTRIL